MYTKIKNWPEPVFQTVDKARPRDLGSGFFYVIKHMKYQQIVV